MAFGFPPSEEQTSFFDLPDDELAQMIKISVNMLEWSVLNRQGKVLEIKTDGFPYEFMTITLKGRGGVHAVSKSAVSLIAFDGGKNRRNLMLFFQELDRQVKLLNKNKKK